MAKSNCDFKGTGGQYFMTVLIHLFILSVITFGIYAPWAWVKIFQLKASHSTIDGKRVTFSGTGLELLLLALVQGLLTIITFGLYGPWALCSFFEWKAKNTLVGDQPSQFHGTGGSLFLLYLVHLMILPMVTLGLYYLLGIYRLYAWKEEHTTYGGEKTSFGAPLGNFIGISILASIVNGLTMNLFTPWSLCMLYKWQVKGLAVGKEQNVDHFPPVKTNFAVVAALIVIGLLPIVGMGLFIKSQFDNFAGNAAMMAQMAQMQQMQNRSGQTQNRQVSVSQSIRPRPGKRSMGSAPDRRKKAGKKEPAPRMDIGMLNDAIKKNGNHPGAYYNRGWLQVTSGNLQQAEKDYSKAIELNGRDSDAYYNRGLLYIKLKKYDLAIQDLTTALTLNPQSADAYCNRGNAHFEAGHNNLALRDYNHALMLKPNDGDLYYNRGVVYLSIGQQEKALGDFRKAAQMGQKNAKEYLIMVASAK